MSRGGDQDGMRVMLFLSLLVTAGLVFGAGVMVGVRLSDGGSCPSGVTPAAADASTGGVERGPPERAADLLFPEVLEGEKPLEQVGVVPQPDAGQHESPPPAAPKLLPSRDGGPAVDAAPASPEKPAVAGSFCLQVAAYREIEPAGQLAEKLRGQGLEAVEVLRSEVPGKGLYFRVRLGRFANAQEAESMRQHLMQKLALDALVVRCP